MRVYASVDDLEDEISPGPTPPNPDRLLALASTAVDTLLAGSVYDVDGDGLPTASEDVAKLTRLTVLQAVYMAPDPEGFRDDFTTMQTSTVHVERNRAATRYAPRALEYLQANGYPGTGLRVYR